MEAFEQLVAEFFRMEGHWVGTSVKIELTKAEKRKIGRYSSPRWELDIIAYHARDNLLRVIECKSYIDSKGVSASAFDGNNPGFAKRFKLFHEPSLRRVVFNRLPEKSKNSSLPGLRQDQRGFPHLVAAALSEAGLGTLGRDLAQGTPTTHGPWGV